MSNQILQRPLPLKFPKKFLWGAATAAHQVHGSPNSNWGRWEISKERLDSLRASGKDPNEYICGTACEFEDRYAKDFALARALGHNASRFSINWATVQENGGWNHRILERYRSMVLYAKAQGIEPVVTLYHWTHPYWFEERGSWKTTSSPALFARFVTEVMKFMGQHVRYFCILNEPTVYGPFSFREGTWPPCEVSHKNYERVMSNLAEAHRRAYRVIKAHSPSAEVGIAHAVAWQTHGNHLEQVRLDRQEGDYLEQIHDQLDWIGLNNYFHCDEGEKLFGWEGKDACTDHPVVSDFGWGMCPRAIGEVLKVFWKKYRKPLLVTEHGHAVAEMDDNRRAWHLWESLKWVHEAMTHGVDVRGYLHWSFLDNFEWAEGFTKKFGIVSVDRTTQLRTPRTSAYLLRDIIAAGGLTEDVARQYRDSIRHPHEK